MQRPDTIIEIHRERDQDQTVDMFSDDKYTPGCHGAAAKATRFKLRPMGVTAVARASESTSVGSIRCVEPPVRCDSTVERLM